MQLVTCLATDVSLPADPGVMILNPAGSLLSWRLRYEIASTVILLPSGPRSAVRNVSGYRCVSDCISRGREFDPGPVPYFHGD